jgi:hypothetical protein
LEFDAMKITSGLLLQCISQDLSKHLDRGPERDWRCFAADALVASVDKKFVDDVAVDADAKALELFLDVNGKLKQSVQPSFLYDDLFLGELRNELYRFWFYPSKGRNVAEKAVAWSLSDCFTQGGVGPGKSLGSEFNDFYSKLSNSLLTTTRPVLYKSYRASTSEIPSCGAAEVARAERFGEYELVECNRLTFAPKRNDISRVICIEPTLNMFYQLGLGKLLESRLATFYGIRLSDQPTFNRELARRGSLDGSFATIDLSSASDSLSYGILKQVLPPVWFGLLDLLRCNTTRLPDGTLVKLNMVSTMGNGFTFPLETILFTAIVNVCYRLSGFSTSRNRRFRSSSVEGWIQNGQARACPYCNVPTQYSTLSSSVRQATLGNKVSEPGNYAVFGDDIIVKREIFDKVIYLLGLLGFRVNADKTFFEGPFRESCGSDFFNGRFVRGVYIKSLDTPQDRYVAINLLNDWTATTGLNLPSSIQLLLESVKRVLIPPEHGFDEGIHVPLSLYQESFDENGAVKYRFFKSKARGVKVGRGGEVSGRRLVNPDGLVYAFLAGYIRSQKIGFRQNKPLYGLKSNVTPRWDYMLPCRSYRRFSYAQWGTAVWSNLYK